MAKFTLECPYCGALNRASTFVLSRNEISCGNCKASINVRANRMTSRKCPHCGNIFIYDQAKGKNVCPACHKKVKIGQGKIAEFPCPQCSCIIQIDKNAGSTTCPVCDFHIENVEMEIQKNKLVNDKGISVIKYEGNNQTFVWKHPIEDFNLGSQLIVHNSQEAIFFVGGKAMDTFGAGRHTLETENLPILRKAYKLPTNSQNPFHAEVYFINKTVQKGIKWGTDSRVRFLDPLTNIPLDIGASGEMSLQVEDSRKLLETIVGTTGGLTRAQITAADAGKSGEAGADVALGWPKDMEGLFRPMMLTKIKSYLAGTIKKQNIDILEIDEHLTLLSDALKEIILPDFSKYGLTIPEFYVVNVSLPEDDENFRRLRNLRSVAYIATKEAEAQTKITEAQREVMKAQKETEIERTKLDAEQKAIEQSVEIEIKKKKGLADVEVDLKRGLAEAEIMRGKGYTQKDVLESEVQKSYAKSLGEFGAKGGNVTVPGSGGGNGMFSDMVGLSVGLGAMGVVGGQVKKMMDNFTESTPEKTENKSENRSAGWKCTCGQDGNIGNFCSNCGSQKPEMWDCPKCGARGVLGRFCSNCGSSQPSCWDCPHCGAKGNRGKFCSSCGKSNTPQDLWDCSKCGAKGNHGKFCSECGEKREDSSNLWDCSCGEKGIKGKFCPECGTKREDVQ